MQFLIAFVFIFILKNSNALYPKESETRIIKSLDGVWNFRVIPIEEDQNIGFTNKWYSHPLELSGEVIPMPVPSSYNDITQSRYIRDYAGWVWYDKEVFVPHEWQQNTLQLRFGSVSYEAVVYVNGIHVVNHTGGHLPFDAIVNKQIKFGEKNLITVAVNNILSTNTLPQGTYTPKKDTNLYPKGFYETSTSFDFFNYAGIHRSVVLVSLPNAFISDIDIHTSIKDTKTGVIDYKVSLSEQKSLEVNVDVFDKKGVKVQSGKGLTGSLTINNVTLWWPYTLNQVSGYQYTLKISLLDSGKVVDVYYQKVGIRTVEVKGTQFLINGHSFYFRGFGKHEDANIRGKGHDWPLVVKDFNLLKWIGANSFRTSHYPYSEEIMDMADEQGIVIIDECPAVGLHDFPSNDKLLKQHLQTLTELVRRDKNRPSVVMWSIANEPHSNEKGADTYFEKVASHTRSLDKSRPISAATMEGSNNDLMAQNLDVLMVNRYYGWYSDTGYPQVIEKQLLNEFDNWNKKFASKPILISEYGADTVAGLHMDPSFIFSEDYQTEFLLEYHKAFDKLRAKGFFIGELYWNFADFMTNEAVNRVIGNKKGIFTRERQPKAGARLLRCRYWKLAGNFDIQSGPDNNFYCPRDF